MTGVQTHLESAVQHVSNYATETQKKVEWKN